MQTLIAVVMGLWVMVHFTCRAAFIVQRSAPVQISIAIIACATSGAGVFFSALCGSGDASVMMWLAASLAAYEAAVWFDGYTHGAVSDFYLTIKRERS